MLLAYSFSTAFVNTFATRHALSARSSILLSADKTGYRKSMRTVRGCCATIPSNATRYFDFWDVVVDHAHRRLYLANGGEGTIVRSGLNGEIPTVIVSGEVHRATLADPVHGNLYFNESETCFCIEQSNLYGSDLVALPGHDPRPTSPSIHKPASSFTPTDGFTVRT